jgi:hypothetical protein
MLKKISLIGSLLFLAACAHYEDVRPGADGIHRVVVTAEDKESGSREAISQATYFCKEKKLMPAFIDEQNKYTGNVDEQTYNTGKTISKAAEMAGGAVWAMGGQKESNAGGVVGLGGAVGSAALGKGYTVEMKFKCQ